MTTPPDRPWPLGIGLLLPVAGFVAFAPIGVLAMPVAALTGLAAVRRREALLLALVAAAFAGWWVLDVGTPAQQVTRCAMTVATCAFVVLTGTLQVSVTHRVLLATWIAALATAALMAATGLNWAELQWWIAADSGTAQMILAGAARLTGLDSSGAVQLIVNRLPELLGVLFPALVAGQIMAGLALASAVVYRAGLSVGTPPGRFREFEFSPLVGLMTAAGAGLALFASGFWLAFGANVLVVALALYWLRGLALLRALWPLQGWVSWIAGPLVVLAALMLWRVTVTGLIVVGAADSALKLRRRLLRTE